jgi:hypothetical protein
MSRKSSSTDHPRLLDQSKTVSPLDRMLSVLANDKTLSQAVRGWAKKLLQEGESAQGDVTGSAGPRET